MHDVLSPGAAFERLLRDQEREPRLGARRIVGDHRRPHLAGVHEHRDAPAPQPEAAVRLVEEFEHPGQVGPPVITYDPSRPETRLAFLVTQEALERGAGRKDVVHAAADTQVRPGSRYIDFLIPGLIGLNLLGTGMWGVGFPVATARQQKLLKRLVATPMRRGDFLLSLMLARMVWLALEVGAVLGFGMIAFGVAVRGSWLGLVLVTVLGALAFSVLGLLVASRARTIEAVSGLMNFVMLPMWLLSGTFFSAERFPPLLQPLVQSLPLTVVNNALRAILNEGAGLAAMAVPVAILAAWTVAGFVLALRLFRWE